MAEKNKDTIQEKTEKEKIEVSCEMEVTLKIIGGK